MALIPCPQCGQPNSTLEGGQPATCWRCNSRLVPQRAKGQWFAWLAEQNVDLTSVEARRQAMIDLHHRRHSADAALYRAAIVEDADRRVSEIAGEALTRLGDPWGPIASAVNHRALQRLLAAEGVLDPLVDARGRQVIERALEEPDAETRVSAVRILAAMPGTTERICETVSDPDERVRSTAVFLLGRLTAPEAVPVLCRALRDKALGVKLEAVRAVAEQRKTLVAALAEGMSAPEENLRAAVAKALGTLGDVSAIPALSETLADKSWKVRHETILALDALGTSEAVPALCRALEDPEVSLRQRAAQALGHVELTSGAVGALLEAVADSRLMIRNCAVAALRKATFPSAVPVLIAGLSHSCDDVRRVAAEVLGIQHAHAAAPALRKALLDPAASFEAAKALVDIPGPERLWGHAFLLGSPPGVAAGSRAILLEAGHKAREPLEAAAQPGRFDLGGAALRTLAELRCAESLPCILDGFSWCGPVSALWAGLAYGHPQTIDAVCRLLRKPELWRAVGVDWGEAPRLPVVSQAPLAAALAETLSRPLTLGESLSSAELLVEGLRRLTSVGPFSDAERLRLMGPLATARLPPGSRAVPDPRDEDCTMPETAWVLRCD